MFILRPIRLLSSDSSCSICCSSCGVSVHRNMSSAKRRLERNFPSIFTPLFSQFNLLNMLSNVAVNSLGEMVSPCLTHLLILIFSLSLCRCTVTELQDFYVHIFYSLFLQLCQYCLGLYWIEYLLVTHESNTQWYVVLRHFSLSWFMACMWSVVEYLLLNPACSLGWFSSSFFSSLVVMIFVNSLYIFDSKQIGMWFLMSFLFPFLKNITILASFHVFGMRRSVMHFVYSFFIC